MSAHDDFMQQVQINLEAQGRDSELQTMSRSWIEKTSRHKYSYNFTHLARPIIQYPEDIVAMQELLWEVKPDLIIETGIAHGGSLILSASMLALLDYCEAATARKAIDPHATRRRVIALDIDIRPHNRAAISAHPLSHYIEMIQGSSIAPEVVDKVRTIARNYERILVCLDSNHTHDHVLRELEAYAPLVSPGSYCVVFDTVIEHMPDSLYADRAWRQGNNPMTAIDKFLTILETGATAADGRPLEFTVDTRIDAKLLISTAPRGYLRRR